MASAVYGPLCVVCGRVDRPGQFRKSGFKCFECKGSKSEANLRYASATASLPATVVTHRPSPVPVHVVHPSTSYHSSPRSTVVSGSPYRVPYSSPRVVYSRTPSPPPSPPHTYVTHPSYPRTVLVDEHTASLERENMHLHQENRRLRQREAWLAEARAAHLDGTDCEWCRRFVNGTHSHPCPWSSVSHVRPDGEFRYS
eukprot:Sspe_Gene.113684::Locus_98400_Transcript_1_1_Confidence_1.000_Length_740::g.113684::m.113684